MDYYESDAPPQTESSYSGGGGSYNFNGQIAVQSTAIRGGGSNYATYSGGSGGGGGAEIVTLDICVNGVAKKINVYAVGQPY